MEKKWFGSNYIHKTGNGCDTIDFQRENLHWIISTVKDEQTLN